MTLLVFSRLSVLFPFNDFNVAQFQFASSSDKFSIVVHPVGSTQNQLRVWKLEVHTIFLLEYFTRWRSRNIIKLGTKT